MKKSKIKNLRQRRIRLWRKKSKVFSAERGFSMVEVLIATFVIIVGVVGVFQVIVRSVGVAPVVRQDLVGARLAEEGVEIVRNIRDGTLLQIGDKYKQGLAPNPSCYATLNCGGDRWEEDFQNNGTLRCSAGGVTSTRRIVLADNTDFGRGVGNTTTPGLELTCLTGTGVGVDTFRVCQHAILGLYATASGSGCPGAPWNPTIYRRMAEVFYRADSAASPLVYGVSATDCNRVATPCAEAVVRVYVWWSDTAWPPSCPGSQCVMLEDRLTNWTDFMQSFL